MAISFEEVNVAELQFFQIVGRGAFGTVKRARWRNIDVAVKIIETPSEKQAFTTELKQLSRVSHPNIVHLFGANTKPPMVCLVMEFAEGGSLYNVLHGNNQKAEFSFAHSISWLLQCAEGVEYLHSMKPKAIIHRDLKPPNLLLMNRGCTIKICDFGTACDVHSHMTNNKGSAAWMAPEVFEGNNYSEKCDVFSWGVIMWEVFTRRKPFDDIGGNAFRIMWAVHVGTRPPPICNCPKPFETLMTRCWSGNHVERPSMTEIVRVMKVLFKAIKTPIKPLAHFAETQRALSSKSEASFNVSQVSSVTMGNAATVKGHKRTGSHGSTITAAAAATSSTVTTTAAGGPGTKTHRRAGSYGSGEYASIIQSSAGIPHVQTEPKDLNMFSAAGAPNAWQQGGGDTNAQSRVKFAMDFDEVKGSQNLAVVGNNVTYSTGQAHESNVFVEFSDNLAQPLSPCYSNQESVKIYEEHVRVANEYRQLQNEIMSLVQLKHDLQLQLKRSQQEEIENTKYISEYVELLGENESLKLLHGTLTQQIAELERGK